MPGISRDFIDPAGQLTTWDSQVEITYRQLYIQTVIYTDRQTGRQTDIYTDRQMYITDRHIQTYLQVEIYAG